jgi:hypothetical protein
MGRRVEFCFGAQDGITGHFLASPLHEFLQWFYSLTPEDYPGQRVDPLVRDLIRQVIEKGGEALVVEDANQADVVDCMIDWFYSDFCDYVRTDLMQQADDSALYVSDFEEARSLIGGCWGKTYLRYWDYLLNGRPVGRSSDLFPYHPRNPVVRHGFWTYEDVVALLPRMEEEQGHSHPTNERARDALQAAWRALSNAQSRQTGLIITVA